MAAPSTTDLRVRALLLSGAREAYAPAEPRTCQCCGGQTDTRDGYDVDTPLGPSFICNPCNLVPAFWNEDVFTGPVAA